MFVTILLAAYNRLHLLRDSLDSALAQDFPNLEILVIDDGSGPETAAWLRDRAGSDSRLRVHFQPHAGAAMARRMGVQLARGEIIVILDSDDILLPGAIPTLVEAFSAHPGTDLIYVNILESLPGRPPALREYPEFRTNSGMLRAILTRPRVPFKHSGTAFRKAAAVAVGSYDASLRSKIDIDLYCKFVSFGRKVRPLGGKPLVEYRVHTDSMSTHRISGLTSWFTLIDLYGPRSPVVRLALKALRCAAELGKLSVRAFSGLNHRRPTGIGARTLPVKKIAKALRRRVLKTEQDRIFDKWWADGGDARMRFEYDLDEKSVILDCGGYEGQWASDMYSRYRCAIHVFEPVSRFAREISHRFRRNATIRVHPFGLGGRTRREAISLSADASSVLKAEGAREEIEIVDIVEWLGREGLDAVDLLKINIEGGEYELLERLLDAGLMASVRHVQVQFHNFFPDAPKRMEAILERLRETHAPTYQYRFVWESWSRKS